MSAFPLLSPAALQRALVWLKGRGWITLLDLAVNFAAPALIYQWAQPRWGEVTGLMISSLPALLWGLGALAVERRVDALSLLALAGIALSLLAFVGGGGPRMLQLRERLVTTLIGLVFVGSAAIGRPLIWAIARASLARRSPEALDALEANRDNPVLRRRMMVMTLVWGFGLLADSALSVVLIFTLSVGRYLVVSPLLGYASTGGLTLWTLYYSRRFRSR